MKLKQFKISEKEQRRIYGSLLDYIDLDYTQDLDSLCIDLEDAIRFLIKIPDLDSEIKNKLMTEDIRVYRGGHHLDVVVNGVGPTGLLTVADSPIPSEFLELKPLKPLKWNP